MWDRKSTKVCFIIICPHYINIRSLVSLKFDTQRFFVFGGGGGHWKKKAPTSPPKMISSKDFLETHAKIYQKSLARTPRAYVYMPLKLSYIFEKISKFFEKWEKHLKNFPNFLKMFLKHKMIILYHINHIQYL